MLISVEITDIITSYFDERTLETFYNPLKILKNRCSGAECRGYKIVKELGVDESKLWYAMKQLREELRCLYARRELGRA